MMRTRKLVAAVALGALATTTLAACSDSGGGSGGDAKTLKLWHYESANSAMGIAWDQAIEIFKKEHPGVKVKF